MSNNGSRCRAAALAAFHGSVSIAVDILQKAAKESERGSVAHELLSLVAMTVAGFPVEERDMNGPQKVWRKMATQLCSTLWDAANQQKEIMLQGEGMHSFNFGNQGNQSNQFNQSNQSKLNNYNSHSFNSSALHSASAKLKRRPPSPNHNKKSYHGRSDSAISVGDRKITLSARSILYLRSLLSFLCSPAGWRSNTSKHYYTNKGGMMSSSMRGSMNSMGSLDRMDRMDGTKNSSRNRMGRSNVRGTGSTYFRQIDQQKKDSNTNSNLFSSTGTKESEEQFGGYDVLLNPNATFDYEGTGIRICDQIGFAAIYLPDVALKKYLAILEIGVIDSGDVSGLLLTGSSSSACPMLQQYIDNTNDLQSVVLLSCSIGMTDKNINNGGNGGSNAGNEMNGAVPSNKFQEWIQLYREMLNRHQLWLERAKFDVARSKKIKLLEKLENENKFNQSKQNNSSNSNSNNGNNSNNGSSNNGTTATSSTTSSNTSASTTVLSASERNAVKFIQRPQVAARCNHCKASFQLSDLLSDASIKRSEWLAKQPSKMLSCPLPKCKKALPRCSICLLPMTVQNPFLYLQKNGYDKKSKKKGKNWEGDNKYNDWFVWCQTCHHGGHTRCLSDWFNRHPKCPVSNCTCVCSMLDCV